MCVSVSGCAWAPCSGDTPAEFNIKDELNVVFAELFRFTNECVVCIVCNIQVLFSIVMT